MTATAPVFNTILTAYLSQVADLERSDQIAATLGVTHGKDEYGLHFFNRRFTIAADRIEDETGAAPNHSTSVILCKYLLLCPEFPSDDATLATYKDFRDSSPYVGGFRSTAEDPIAKGFSGRVDQLEQRCRNLGGRPFETDVSCQLAFQFTALPRVPVFLLFHDADDEFPAQCTLLFHKNAASYLDMECIAMIGATLASRLQDR